jgi:hypothetical protein
MTSYPRRLVSSVLIVVRITQNGSANEVKQAIHNVVQLTFVLGGRRLPSGPVGSDAPTSQPLTVHRGDCTLCLLQHSSEISSAW